MRIIWQVIRERAHHKIMEKKGHGIYIYYKCWCPDVPHNTIHNLISLLRKQEACNYIVIKSAVIVPLQQSGIACSGSTIVSSFRFSRNRLRNHAAINRSERFTSAFAWITISHMRADMASWHRWASTAPAILPSPYCMQIGQIFTFVPRLRSLI